MKRSINDLETTNNNLKNELNKKNKLLEENNRKIEELKKRFDKEPNKDDKETQSENNLNYLDTNPPSPNNLILVVPLAILCIGWVIKNSIFGFS